MIMKVVVNIDSDASYVHGHPVLLNHLIFTTHGIEYCYPHFVDGEIKALKGAPSDN